MNHSFKTYSVFGLLLCSLLLSACGKMPIANIEEESSTLQTVTLVDGTVFEYDLVEGDVIVEGDIILGSVSDLEEAIANYNASLSELSPQVVAREKCSRKWYWPVERCTIPKWPGGVVYYSFASDLSKTLQDRVVDAMDHWEAETPIRFVRSTRKERVIFRSSTSGCSATVGYRSENQYVRLADSCSRGNIIHEIGHTIGLWHEHTRCDRDDYVTIVSSNIEDDKKHNFTRHCKDGKDIGPYDYASIMHYSERAFVKDDLPSTARTIVPLNSGVSIGQRNGLSYRDAFYGGYYLYKSVLPCKSCTSYKALDLSRNGTFSDSFVFTDQDEQAHLRVDLGQARLELQWWTGSSWFTIRSAFVPAGGIQSLDANATKGRLYRWKVTALFPLVADLWVK